MKISKKRPKFHFLDKNRNKIDSPLGFVLLFTASFRLESFGRYFFFFLVSCIVKTRNFKLLYFRNESCYGTGNLYKDLFFVYLLF